jgi:eukaryotic-like serine/threonine-protein kinase
VRRSDARAMLVDFGTGLYPGASPLTPPMTFPGTPVYRSPQSWLFELRFYSSSSARYVPSAADDLYALGVTTCRLLTGEYPQPAQPSQDEHGTWHLGEVLLPPALLSSPHIEPSLRAFTLRLLSVKPEQRGTAAQLAEELEQTLRPAQAGRSTDNAASPRMRARTRYVGRWGVLVAACLAAAVWTGRTVPDNTLKEHSAAPAKPSEAASAEAGTAGLGDAATTSAVEQAPSPSAEDALSENTLPQPIPGQVRTDEKGHCPGKGLVSLNGACWTEYSWEAETCLTLGGQMFKGTCYLPLVPPGRRPPPTSAPLQKQ